MFDKISLTNISTPYTAFTQCLDMNPVTSHRYDFFFSLAFTHHRSLARLFLFLFFFFSFFIWLELVKEIDEWRATANLFLPHDLPSRDFDISRLEAPLHTAFLHGQLVRRSSSIRSALSPRPVINGQDLTT